LPSETTVLRCSTTRLSRRGGFTLIELLVVIAVIALLIGLLLPALGATRLNARATVCLSRVQQLGVGVAAYLNDFDRMLPQRTWDVGGQEAVIGSLFGGKKGQLPFYGINQVGAEGRPLNRYVFAGPVSPDDGPDNFPMPPFASPVDRGATTTGLPIPGLDRTDSFYDFIGSSYTLNDHDLRGDEYATLVPQGGGRMPHVTQPSRTWVIGTHTIYNFQQGGDRGSRWFGKAKVEANLSFLDGHAKMRVTVPPGVVNETSDYVFGP
jgi:prepilin-type N-terminal cleavage/methylation domain-containing protein